MFYLHTQLHCRLVSNTRYFILISLDKRVCGWEIVQAERLFMIIALCARVRAQQQQDHALCRNFAIKTTKWMFYDKKCFSMKREQWWKLLNELKEQRNYSFDFQRILIKMESETSLPSVRILVNWFDSKSNNQPINQRMFVWLLIALTTYHIKSRA